MFVFTLPSRGCVLGYLIIISKVQKVSLFSTPPFSFLLCSPTYNPMPLRLLLPLLPRHVTQSIIIIISSHYFPFVKSLFSFHYLSSLSQTWLFPAGPLGPTTPFPFFPYFSLFKPIWAPQLNYFTLLSYSDPCSTFQCTHCLTLPLFIQTTHYNHAIIITKHHHSIMHSHFKIMQHHKFKIYDHHI